MNRIPTIEYGAAFVGAAVIVTALISESRQLVLMGLAIVLVGVALRLARMTKLRPTRLVLAWLVPSLIALSGLTAVVEGLVLTGWLFTVVGATFIIIAAWLFVYLGSRTRLDRPDETSP